MTLTPVTVVEGQTGMHVMHAQTRLLGILGLSVATLLKFCLGRALAEGAADLTQSSPGTEACWGQLTGDPHGEIMDIRKDNPPASQPASSQSQGPVAKCVALKINQIYQLCFQQELN